MNHFKRLNALCSVLIFYFSFAGFGQQREYIMGKVFAAETDEPVVFANIRIKGRSLGVISNFDGGFKIPIKYKTYGDTLEISSMGYQVLEIDLNDLKLFENNMLKLIPKVEILDEVVLVSKKKKKTKKTKNVGLKAEEIVLKAIQGIPRNFPKVPFSYVGYYRDYQVKDDHFLNLNEAILEVFDNGFETNDYLQTNYALYEYLGNTDFPRESFGEKPYDNENKYIPGAKIQSRKGNELLILRNMDALRNYNLDTYSYVYQFDKDFINNHWFRKNEDITLGEVNLYSIAVSKRTSDHLIFGTMFISKASFAIYKFDYEVYSRYNQVSSGSDYENLKKEATPIFSVQVGYNENQGLMYPNYISFSNQFVTYGDPRFRVENVSLDLSGKRVLVSFNNEPSKANAQKVKSYELSYNAEQIEVESIELDKKKAVLHFSKAAWERLKKIAQENNGMDSDRLQLNVKDVKDIDKNLINVPEEVTRIQFREFFVQKLKPNISSPPSRNLMRKDFPIFKNHPIIKPDNFGDYWMNTPLKTIKE